MLSSIQMTHAWLKQPDADNRRAGHTTEEEDGRRAELVGSKSSQPKPHRGKGRRPEHIDARHSSELLLRHQLLQRVRPHQAKRRDSRSAQRGRGGGDSERDRQPEHDHRHTCQQPRAVRHKQGGAFFEIFASVTPNVLDPIYAPIEFTLDRAKREATLRVPGIAESHIEPIRNPVTGEEHVARIVMPNGFEYKEADMGNTVSWKAKLGDKTLTNENCYAQIAFIDWSND